MLGLYTLPSSFALNVCIYVYVCTHIPVIEASEATLDRVISSSTDLDTRQRAIEEALVGVVDLATSVLEECEDRNGDCERLPDPSIFVNTANYSLVRLYNMYIHVHIYMINKLSRHII